MILNSASTLVTAVPPGEAAQLTSLGTGETVLFWILAPIMVLAALGLLFARKAVHAALGVVVVMICMAMMYAAQGAHFLFAAQIVVYTGAVMMLFLFVLMLVGVDSSDGLFEVIKGQRLITAVAVIGFLLLLVAPWLGWLGLSEPKLVVPSTTSGHPRGNAVDVALVLFGPYILALEMTGILLITAAVSAILLTHRERLVPRTTQPELAGRRVRANRFVAGLPAPGVFARHNSVDTPALLPDGTPSEESVSRVLRARGQERSATGLASPVKQISDELSDGGEQG